MCAMQRYICYRDRKYSSLFNTDSKGTESSTRIKEMFKTVFNADSKKTVSSVRNAKISML